MIDAGYLEFTGAYEVYVAGRGPGPVVLTCEHASNRIPQPFKLPVKDRWVLDTHWAWDPGAATLTRSLARAMESVAVFAAFSRLLVDPNRAEDRADLFRDQVDGRALVFNQGLTEAEREARLEGWYRPYHAAVDEYVSRLEGLDVLSIHSFTPVYEREKRDVQVGVLYSDPELGGVAEALCRSLSDSTGLDVRVNEPWSGLGGLMDSVDRHAGAHGRRGLELEFRQDLLAKQRNIKRFTRAVVDGLREVDFGLWES